MVVPATVLLAALIVSLLPTTPVMFLGILMILLASVHLLGLFGYGGR